MTGGTVAAARRDRLRAALQQSHPDVDALLVTGLTNVRYLAGFTGSHGVLMVDARDGRDLLGTDGRYTLQCEAECPGLPLVVDRDALGALAAVLAEGRRRAAVEAEHMSIAAGSKVAEALGRDPVPTCGIVEGLRATKDSGELDDIARACAVTVAALEAILPEIHAGVTERAIARRLEALMVDLGAEGPAFPSIIASGPNSAIPHHQPTDRALVRGDLLKMDFGAMVAGYHADMTRTFVVGGSAAGWQEETHAAVREAQEAGRAAMRPGASAYDVDRAARDVLEGLGLAERFVHGLGHGVGLDIHEAPFLGPRATGRIAPSMAVTVEPGVYLPGRGGVRIEDTFLVSDGGTVPLTGFSADLLAVG